MHLVGHVAGCMPYASCAKGATCLAPIASIAVWWFVGKEVMQKIYFAGDRTDPHYFKIGGSGNPLQRLKTLQTTRPGMYLIDIIPGTPSDEEWTRKRFSRWHVAKETYCDIPMQLIKEFCEIARRFASQGIALTVQKKFEFMDSEEAA